MIISFSGSSQLSQKLILNSVDTDFEVLFASDLDQSMEHALRQDVGVCVYEWEFFGTRLAEQVRSNPIKQVSKLPIVILVDGSTDFKIEEVQFYQVDLIMYKPFITQHLFNKIKKLF